MRKRVSARISAAVALAGCWFATPACRDVLGIDEPPTVGCVKDSDCNADQRCESNACVSACDASSCAGAPVNEGGGGAGGRGGAGPGGTGGEAGLMEAGASTGGSGTGVAGVAGVATAGRGGTGGSGGGGGAPGAAGAAGSEPAGASGEPGAAICQPGQKRCWVNDPTLPAISQSCEHGDWQTNQLCRDYCNAGECVTSPSCSGLQRTCGPNSESCCTATEIPGGTFKRSFDGDTYTDDSFSATVSPFIMDKYEVTVGRFRKFVAAYPLDLPQAGAGKSHFASDPGWSTSWPMPATAADLIAQQKCPNSTWADPPLSDTAVEVRPINCTNFYVAYAFCIWEGGRLPTEAEWNFAAAGGSEQRAYPWLTVDNSRIGVDDAVYNADAEQNGLPSVVGSKSCTSQHPSCGDGRWGQADLAGNVLEWTLDYFSDPYPNTSCVDCWYTTTQSERVLRGGEYEFNISDLVVAERFDLEPAALRSSVGFRCVYDLSE